MTDVDPNIFSSINFDEGDDNPWGLSPGTHETEISDAKIERSKNKNLGLWLTFSDTSGKSIRRWTTLPEKDQEDETRKRNTSYLRRLLRDLDIPEEKWGSLDPDDFIGIKAAITVKPQKDNEEYNQITKIRKLEQFSDGSGMHEFLPPKVGTPAPSDGGVGF